MLDRARPLHVAHLADRLTVAVVSVAWLRAQSEAVLARLEARHLAPEEAARAAALHVPRRRYEWLAGRFAVKHGVCAYLRRHRGRDAGTRAVRVGAVPHGPMAGRPVVDAPVGVGISHSGDFAVAACGPHAVGIDLEHRRTLSPPLALLLSREGDPRSPCPEGGRLAGMPLPLRWACKEAVLKYYGFGLRVDFREVALTGWHHDGWFSWRAGPGLLRHAPTADRAAPRTWAREVGGCFLALVWT
ncbi:4'-phosphopantetheinyl transferase family protein [Streptomyces aurantiogriseus]|uniref:4'-phosphopantetheinyl transferase n=1 Tax=Streptomyces aurantiogriseus TaxID=66870 RepID=A0A918FJ44_9ACTN|nr:hypothetical protein [Streptomyces aurantiogriseus]GGR41847.1 hypothetical protein GCM10010251_68330 [Streptomyces aurantiogriseus]